MGLLINRITSFDDTLQPAKVGSIQTIVVGKMVFEWNFKGHFRLYLYGILKDNIRKFIFSL
jgi:hypothetical protein